MEWLWQRALRESREMNFEEPEVSRPYRNSNRMNKPSANDPRQLANPRSGDVAQTPWLRCRTVKSAKRSTERKG
jgi:hypothetical protein